MKFLFAKFLKISQKLLQAYVLSIWHNAESGTVLWSWKNIFFFLFKNLMVKIDDSFCTSKLN